MGNRSFRSIEPKRVCAAICCITQLLAFSASAQESSIYVQCPPTTPEHPSGEGIKCTHLVAGDGMVTMADDTQKEQYIFGFAEIPDDDPGQPAINTVEYADWVVRKGMLAAMFPAPTISLDEDDEFFLTLSNVGMMMRPDLSDPHTVHWHGFRNAASIFDGVPDASVAVNMMASLTYYYSAQDPGTYMYHCHVEATEHMQMGMLGNLYVRPAQNKLANGTALGSHVHSNPDFGPGDDSLVGDKYVYNDGDGSTLYDVEYPIQIGSFDPDFHDASLNVQPLPFAAMRDRYFLLNGRGYPDTVNPNVLSTVDPMGMTQPSQQLSSLISAAPGQRILLRISNLNVTNFYTLGTNGLPMEVVGRDARLLRDEDGNNMYYKTNSLTLGGGQSVDVIIDTTGLSPNSTYFLYTKNLDRLANDAENFGGMMTEIQITE